MIKYVNTEPCVPQTFIIAEIGSNHAQSLEIAKESIQAAKAAGADAVKFQSLSVTEQYFQPSDEIVALHKQIDLAESWYSELQSQAEKESIIFISSPTYLKSVQYLEQVKARMYKLASAQIATFPQLVETVAKLNKPTFFSTGLVNYAETQQIVELFEKHQNTQYTILHCNSLYPPHAHQIQLGQIQVYKAMFQCPVGFSDHSMGISIPIAAVALGASVIEKHFTIDKSLDSPDAALSLLPTQFKQMCSEIREVEKALPHQPRLEIESLEAEFRSRIEVKLVLNKAKKSGETLNPSDFRYLRHSDGICCKKEPLVTQHFVLQRPLEKGTLLTWNMLKGK